MIEFSPPTLLDINLIDEDPNQPRKEDNPGFSQQSLKELALTIAERGVKSPISVRSTDNGRFIINHGARRFRASKLAGKTTIPAFIDNDYTHLDQLIENIQRDALTPREVADYIGYKISMGFKKSEIANELGKSNAWVSQHSVILDMPEPARAYICERCISQHSVILDMPEPIAKAFNKGRIQDLTALNELVKIYNKCPEDVEQIISDGEDISRSSVQYLKEYSDSLSEVLEEKIISKKDKHQGPQGPRPKVIVRYNGQECELKIKKSTENKVTIILEKNQELEVFPSELEILKIE